MELKTYYDFADDDRKYLMMDYQNGRVANYMGSMSQSICERYMKHIISEYRNPQSKEDAQEMDSVLRTHNLNRLIKYLDSELDFTFPREVERSMKAINGFYFSTRYPGDDSYTLNKNDIEDCVEAVNGCQEVILAYMEKQKSLTGILEES